MEDGITIDTLKKSRMSRRYSIEELLQLRRSPNSLPYVAKWLQRVPDADLLRIPDAIFGEIHPYPLQSQALTDTTNHKRLTRNENLCSENDASEIDAQTRLAPKLLSNPVHTRWQFRRRNSSHHSHQSSEPLPAPSGIATQQAENFERFYRAVVSPSHVRVTAGGRIVLNDRPVAPPKFNWDFDRRIFAPQTVKSHTESQGRNILDSTLQQDLSMKPSKMGTEALNSYVNPEMSFGRESRKISLKSRLHAQQSIKISPPSQFDHSRPFLLNGQIVYPLPLGIQLPSNSIPMPMAVLGDPVVQQQLAMMPGFFPPRHTNSHPTHFVPPPIAVNQFPAISAVSPNCQPGANHAHLSQYGPEMAPLFDLFPQQVDEIHRKIREIDERLSANYYDPARVSLIQRRSELVAYLEQNANLPSHLSGEESDRKSSLAYDVQPITSKSPEGVLSHTNLHISRADKTSISSESVDSQPSLTQQDNSQRQHNITIDAFSLPPVPLFVPPSQQLVACKDNEALEKDDYPSSDIQKPSISDTVVKSRLTAAAARAPPFKPRAKLTPTPQNTDLERFDSTETFQNGRRSFISLTSGSPGHGCRDGSKLMVSLPSLTESKGEFHDTRPTHDYLSPSIIGGNDSSYFAKKSLSEPYLIGTLPNGIHFGDASRSLCTYSRPLTEDEIRARHLYWGNAPRSTLRGSGLPKFDGKDFYPPSPKKNDMAIGSVPLSGDYQTLPKSIPNHNPNVYQSLRKSYTSKLNSDHGQDSSKTILEDDLAILRSPLKQPPIHTPNKVHALDSVQNSSELKKGSNYSPNVLNRFSPDSLDKYDFSTLFTSPTVPAPVPCSEEELSTDIRLEGPRNKPRMTLSRKDSQRPPSRDSWGAADSSHYSRSSTSRAASIQNGKTPCRYPSAATLEQRTEPGKEQIIPNHAPLNLVNFQAKYCQGKEPSTVFLQNMLKNTASTLTTAPATVSSATAQGYLPSHQGSAVASLTPATSNQVPTPELRQHTNTARLDHIKISHGGKFEVSTDGVTPLVAANFLPENRPLDRDQPRRPINPAFDTIGAEEYLRYLAQRIHDDRGILAEGWNSRTTGTGPITGSDW